MKLKSGSLIRVKNKLHIACFKQLKTWHIDIFDEDKYIKLSQEDLILFKDYYDDLWSLIIHEGKLLWCLSDILHRKCKLIK